MFWGHKTYATNLSQEFGILLHSSLAVWGLPACTFACEHKLRAEIDYMHVMSVYIQVCFNDIFLKDCKKYDTNRNVIQIWKNIVEAWIRLTFSSCQNLTKQLKEAARANVSSESTQNQGCMLKISSALNICLTFQCCKLID